MDHRGVIAPAETAPDLGQRAGGELLGEIHRHLARAGDLARAPRRGHLRLADAIVIGHAALDFVDRDAALIGAQHVGQRLGDELQIDRPAAQRRISDHAVERAFQLAHVRRDPLGEEQHHLLRHLRLRHRLELLDDDVEPELEVGRIDVRHEAP